MERAAPPAPPPLPSCWTKTDDRPKKLSQKRMYKQTGINPQANTAASVAGVAQTGLPVFFLSSIFFSIHRSDLTTVSPTLPAFLCRPPPPVSRTPLRANVATLSVASGMYLTLAGLRGDGCERVSDEEEVEAARARQAVNR